MFYLLSVLLLCRFSSPNDFRNTLGMLGAWVSTQLWKATEGAEFILVNTLQAFPVADHKPATERLVW